MWMKICCFHASGSCFLFLPWRILLDSVENVWKDSWYNYLSHDIQTLRISSLLSDCRWFCSSWFSNKIGKNTLFYGNRTHNLSINGLNIRIIIIKNHQAFIWYITCGYLTWIWCCPMCFSNITPFSHFLPKRVAF